MNDAARKDDELSKQDTGRWKRYHVLLFYMWTMAHHPYKKQEKYYTTNNNQLKNNNSNKEEQELLCPNAVEPLCWL